MALSLDQWQERLETHFSQLAATRSFSDFPLFALEHGLTEDEFQEITSLLHARLADGGKLGRHWLVWAAYATELGYDYDGGDYWPSFEERTPHWHETVTSNRRNQLRTWFSKFHTTFQGVKPSGPWAEHFSIISWPITHAILPKYLQWQLAKTLYELRHQLANLDTLNPVAVGELLAANAWESTSRFREFLQQQELAGRIVLALLSDRAMLGQSPVYPQTLQRLVSALGEVQSTREWLKETRTIVAERLKGSARAPGGVSALREGEHPGVDTAARAAPRIRPTLMLRRSAVSTWSLVINVPSLGGAVKSNPELHAFLRNTRCKVTGTGETWLPTGWLLSGFRRRVLKTWPGAGAPLVQFERPNPVVDQLIGIETRLPAGPIWLCRIGRDGLAREVAGRIVRPGRKYLLLSEAELASPHPFFASCNTDCAGIHASLLSMPDTLSFESISRLQQLGLQVARTVRIWPVGLSGRGFDGEGHSEWLTTEAPCFGIVHDHPVDTYSLRLDAEAEIIVSAAGVNTPVFVKIGRLRPGRHTLLVKARRINAPGMPASPTAEGVVTLDVREPEPWIPGTTSHAGLAISVDPPDSSLDTFWDGNVAVTILGPVGHQVTCAMNLYTAGGKELLAEPIGTFDLPVTPPDWFGKFSAFARDERRTWTYLEATAAKFIVRADELGEYALRLERDVKPVRWVCRNINKVTTARLIDDTGGDTVPICRFFSFRRPAVPVTLDTETVMAGFEVTSPGGVFEVSHGRFHDAVNISIPPTTRGFVDLLIEPDLHEFQANSAEVASILASLKLWSETRLLGPLVAIRRNRIIERLASSLYSQLCGRGWADAEAAYLAQPDSNFQRQYLEKAIGGPHAFSMVLSREFDHMDADTSGGLHWFGGVATRYQVSADLGLCEFALQLASRPHGLLPIPVSVLDGLLLDIKKNAILLRGARFVALLAARRSPGPFGGVYPRWKW